MSASNASLSLDDLWVERELTLNLLGRLMDLSKDFAGKEIKIPVTAATGLRNVLLKHSYFEAIPEASTSELLERIQQENKTIKETIKKLSDFFKTAPKIDYSTKTWEEISKIIAAPLLDDIVQKSKEPAFAIQKWTLDECIARANREERNLERLARYQGLYNSEDCHKIVSLCCKARWGSTSSYVKANARGLFGYNTDPTIYAYLVKEEYILLGNEFRHPNQPLVFSKVTPVGSVGGTGSAGILGASTQIQTTDSKERPALLFEATPIAATNTDNSTGTSNIGATAAAGTGVINTKLSN